MSAAKPAPDPHSLTPDELANILATVSRQPVPIDWIVQDLAAGAPANADGTISLIRYAAWLLKEMQRDH